MTLKEKAIKGTTWSIIGNIIQTISSFLIGIIIARRLTPSEYGLIGMASVFIFFTYVFIDSGFGTALVQKKNCSNSDYSTVFYFNLAISFFFFALLYLTSGFIAQFYNEPELKSIVKVLSLLIILYSLTLVNRAILTREINFKLINLIQIVSQIISGIIGIILAYSGYGVWSLVWKTLLNQILANIGFWIFSHWIPRFEFSLFSLKEMFSFSSKLLISGIINSFYEQSYNLVIGKFFQAKELGLYTRANQFRNLPLGAFSNSVMSVSFPIFTKLQDDPLRFKNAAKKIIKLTMFINIITMLGMAAISDNLVLFLIGEKWKESAFYLQLLCIEGILYPLHPINLNIITSLGRSDLFLKLEIIKKLLVIPVILVGMFSNVRFMILSMIVVSFISIFVNTYYSKMLINYGIKEQFSDIKGSLFLGILMSLVVFFLGCFSDGMINKMVILFLQIIVGIVITVLGAMFFSKDELYELIEIFKTNFFRIK